MQTAAIVAVLTLSSHPVSEPAPAPTMCWTLEYIDSCCEELDPNYHVVPDCGCACFLVNDYTADHYFWRPEWCDQGWAHLESFPGGPQYSCTVIHVLCNYVDPPPCCVYSTVPITIGTCRDWGFPAENQDCQPPEEG